MDWDHLHMLYYELTMSIGSWLCICSGVVSGVAYAANDHANNSTESINYYYLIYHKEGSGMHQKDRACTGVLPCKYNYTIQITTYSYTYA